MRAQLLRNPMTIKVEPIENYKGGLDCHNPEYTPFKESSYEATAHALWYTDAYTFIAISRDERRLVVPISFTSPWTVKEIGNNLEGGFIENCKEANRYGIKAFVEDCLMMRNSFDVEVLDTNERETGIDFHANFNWQLHGHVKWVKNINQYIAFTSDEERTIVLL